VHNSCYRVLRDALVASPQPVLLVGGLLEEGLQGGIQLPVVANHEPDAAAMHLAQGWLFALHGNEGHLGPCIVELAHLWVPREGTHAAAGQVITLSFRDASSLGEGMPIPGHLCIKGKTVSAAMLLWLVNSESQAHGSTVSNKVSRVPKHFL